MKKYKELTINEMQEVIGGKGPYTWPSTAFPNPYGNGNPFDMALGGTTFTAYGYGGCPGNSILLGYIGGGTYKCRKR